MSLITDKTTLDDWLQARFHPAKDPWWDIETESGPSSPRYEERSTEFYTKRPTIVVGWDWMFDRFPVSMMRFIMGDNDNLELDLEDLLLKKPWWPTVTADEEGDKLYA